MVITGWHGGWGRFSAVDPQHLGTGENDALGWGFYLSENRAGGEDFARYAELARGGTGYLHKVRAEVPRPCLWWDPWKRPWTAPDGSEVSWEGYDQARRSLGNEVAAAILRRLGVKAIAAWETDTSSHGRTYVVLDLAAIRVVESYEWRVVDGLEGWHRIM